MKNDTWRRLPYPNSPEPSRRLEHFKNKSAEEALCEQPQSPAGKSGSETARKSGAGRLAAGIIGPVAIEPGDAPFDALAETGKSAILDDRVMHRAQFAIAQHDIGAAVAARNIVRLPGPQRGFM